MRSAEVKETSCNGDRDHRMLCRNAGCVCAHLMQFMRRRHRSIVVTKSLISAGVLSETAVRHVEIGGESKIMKVISLKEASPEMLKRAEREVTLLRSLSCPNVVAVESDLIELGIPPYGATWLEEFLDGEDLSGLLGSPWDWEDVRLMGLQIAVALSAAHQVGVVHRDLSANNVRRLSNGDFRVLDFGFARHTLLSGVTIAGQPGTLGFCSPEHLNGYSGGPMPASDVFCVGILMYTALAGESPIPYLGDSDDYLHRLMNVEFVPLSEVCAGIPDDLTKVVERQAAVAGAVITPFASPYTKSAPTTKRGAVEAISALLLPGRQVWFDPMTHALQMSNVGDFRYYDGYNLWPAGSRGDLSTPKKIEGHITRIFEVQSDLGVPHLAPTVLLNAPLSDRSVLALDIARMAMRIDSSCALSIAGTASFWSGGNDLDAHIGSQAALEAQGWFLSVVRPTIATPVAADSDDIFGLCRTARALSEDAMRQRQCAQTDYSRLAGIAVPIRGRCFRFAEARTNGTPGWHPCTRS
ncbi:protein kinase [Aduncisulcus paluster]|uniref:non-specific serine/threonine protein kinase n=1 Tax=Aduncisulcus paluster TaxID=2918883 RepID=A0ABQ5KGY7_9EUKA|nr:protein kinase [Aduncisulcus paluster]